MATVATRATDLVEIRTRGLLAAGVEVRAADDSGGKKFTGHAAVFNSRTAIGNPLTWGWYEEVADGAFTKTLQEGDARFLVDHDTSLLVARVSAGDLTLAEDKTGLAVDAGLDDQLSYVRDLIRNLEMKRITGMSFGFYVVKDDWNEETVELNDGNSADVWVRVIREVKLLEVSAVTFPAYDETDASLRDMALSVRNARGVTADLAALEGRPDVRQDTVEEPAAATPDPAALIARKAALWARREQHPAA